MELIATLPPGVRIVSMLIFNNQLVVATERGVYRFNGKTFDPVEFTSLPAEN